MLQKGDYVVATKYSDGDPQDQWCIGFYERETEHDPKRHIVVDDRDIPFRINGFRRVQKISLKTGKYILDNIKAIEAAGVSIWKEVERLNKKEESLFRDYPIAKWDTVYVGETVYSYCDNIIVVYNGSAKIIAVFKIKKIKVKS